MWRIQPLSKSEQLERFEAEVGEAARRRQEELAKAMWPCCGEPKVGPHHEACSKRPAELEAPAVIDGQMALA